MYEVSHHELDRRLAHTLDRVGVVGTEFRATLAHDLKAKVLFRAARDAVELVGQPGTGRHQAARAAHAAAHELLDREGAFVEFDCGLATDDARAFERSLTEAADRASGGSLVLDRWLQLDARRRDAAGRVLDREDRDLLTLAVSAERGTESNVQGYRPATRIQTTPLHEREADLWELVDHFFQATAQETGERGCRGFSRQAKADIAQAVRDVNLVSIRRLRDIVRDVVFEHLADGPLPLKLTSDEVRPYLERTFRQTEEDRRSRDQALVASQFEAVVERSLLERLSELHGVPQDLLERQVQIQREVVGYIDDVPRSYRNIMDRLDDVQRASLWLMTGATTQAEFRRFYGDERFMRPTKSVAWAFYNRVFKRD